MVVGDVEEGAELVVIGAGPGGYTAAIRAAQKDMDVVVIDKEEVGGICLNHGCIPAKALIHASKYRADLKHWDEIGIHTKELEVDFESIQEWKEEVVEKLDTGIEQLFEAHNIEYKQGYARFIDEETVRVEEEHDAENVKFEKAIIATGSRPIEIPGFEFDKERVISSRDLLQLEEVPDEIVVIGGGYIGMEAVTKFCKFGSTVKVLEAQDRVLSGFDEEIVDHIRETSACYGDEIYTGVTAKEAVPEGEKVTVKAETDGENIEVEGDYVLVAVGRTPELALDGLNIEKAGVETTENGFVDVDEQLRSSNENIFAIGDCAGQPMLAHKAYREGKVAAEAAAGKNTAFDSQYIPKVAYTDPEIAAVGMTPMEAEEQFESTKVGKFKFSASGRALTANKPDGFVRVVARESGKLEGVQIVGPHASDIIAEATLALEMQGYLDDVANTIHAHPTFPEVFSEACEDAMDESIHKT
ncbi:dihydrolipoyl dehydrogenase [Candidatus Nanohalococcus occultus]|uniref:dihydrolipoyl dehydrogenase n=1 Tax=Candidatus Nanohalococcus occultus TaxID=2978047 RepID=UPI0039E176C7